MIVAYCRNRGIGIKGKLPFKIQDDMLHFKKLTIGNKNNAIIMGKNTWLSLSKRPLPHRDNLVLSRSLTGNHIFSSMSSVEKYCREKKYDEIWIIGGDDIYKQFIGNANLETICVTEVDVDGEGCDAFFPQVPTWFDIIFRGKEHICNDTSFQYVIHERPDIYMKNGISWKDTTPCSGDVM